MHHYYPVSAHDAPPVHFTSPHSKNHNSTAPHTKKGVLKRHPLQHVAEEEEEEEETDTTVAEVGGPWKGLAYCMSWHALLSMFFFLACTTFSILVIYSLVVDNTERVHTACTDLYPYMVTRTGLSFCVFFAMCTYGLMYGPTRRPERNPVLVFFFLIYFVVLAIWGAVVVSKSMIGNTVCYDALYDSAFHAPLLGDLGWVYIVVDVFYALCTVLIILRTQITRTDDGDPNEDEENDQA